MLTVKVDNGVLAVSMKTADRDSAMDELGIIFTGTFRAISEGYSKERKTMMLQALITAVYNESMFYIEKEDSLPKESDEDEG